MNCINVKISEQEKSYPIIINDNDIAEIKEKIQNYTRGSKILVVVSKKVDKLYGKKLGFEKFEKFILNDGEKEKNFKNYQRILKKAFEMQLTRKDTIIAIGGGVVGDIAGFAASTYMRGIDYIQVPTTLLACVDSSVGGKTGIDTIYGKNLVGSFYQPKAVLINTNFLKTLDERQFKTGLGEVVKYTFIEKSCKCNEELNLTNFLSENAEKILAKNPDILKELIQICIKLKVAVVQQDEKEGGLRKILNFGHTYGHAVEKFTQYKKYTHGEAIVKGMEFAFNLAVKKNLIDVNYKYFADDVIKKFNFKKIPDYPLEKMIKIMKLDKKAETDKINFILPEDYSQVSEYSLSIDELKKIFAAE